MIGASRPTQTAQILVFPLRERMAAKATPEQKFAAMEAIARRCAATSGGWYHEAALAGEDDGQQR